MKGVRSSRVHAGGMAKKTVVMDGLSRIIYRGLASSLILSLRGRARWIFNLITVARKSIEIVRAYFFYSVVVIKAVKSAVVIFFSVYQE